MLLDIMQWINEVLCWHAIHVFQTCEPWGENQVEDAPLCQIMFLSITLTLNKPTHNLTSSL